MKPELKAQPRKFEVKGRWISDYGKVHLEPWEMVSIVRDGVHECDVAATDWGLYLAPSLNARLRDNGYRTALVRNPQGRLYLNAVLVDRVDAFFQYLKEEESELVTWLAEDEGKDEGR